MTLEISNSTKSILTISNVFYASGCVYGGRKFCLASGYRLSSIFIKMIDQQKATEWKQTGKKYFAQAIKDAPEDLMAAISLMSFGFISSFEKTPSLPIKNKEIIKQFPFLVPMTAMALVTNGFAMFLGCSCIKWKCESVLERIMDEWSGLNEMTSTIEILPKY